MKGTKQALVQKLPGLALARNETPSHDWIWPGEVGKPGRETRPRSGLALYATRHFARPGPSLCHVQISE